MKQNSWVSLPGQVEKTEQPTRRKPDQYSRSPLPHERLVEDAHTGVSSRAQNTVLSRDPAPSCRGEAFVQLQVLARTPYLRSPLQNELLHVHFQSDEPLCHAALRPDRSLRAGLRVP
ncbi:uncharacterized protein RG961_006611 [Leptosomus discolor]